MSSELTTDILVVGSGPGGATVSHILAERGKDVLMVEEGRSLPLDSCNPFSLDEMVQKYRAGGLNPALGRGKIAFAEGRVVGGGSEINSGLYHRTPPEILEGWKREFRFDPGDMTGHFEYNEHSLNVQLSPLETPLASRKLEHGAKRLGWKAMEVPRWFSYRNGTGTRNSMSRTYVPRAIQAGARLLPNTRVTRLRRIGGSWLARTGAGSEIRARQVVVSGGAVQTPHLLRRSGITACIGNSLALHPTVKAVALFPEKVNYQHMGVPVHQVKEFSPRISLGCSISSLPHLALALADQPHFRQLISESWGHMATYYGMISGPNTGTIRAVAGLPDPLVRYELTPEHWQEVALALRYLCRVLLAAGATCVYPGVSNLPPISSEEDLSKIPATLEPCRANAMTIHLFSSCPLGEVEERCATDSWGRVRGAEGLWIADASLIPTSMGVNPQGTVMALAHRNAMKMLGDL